MTAKKSTTQALTAWINTMRQQSPLLDDDADPLLARVNAAAWYQQTLRAARNARCCIGLYGHSSAAKSYLLSALCGDDSGRVSIRIAQRVFNYFTHINPENSPASMAMRFTRHAGNETNPAFPLRLKLISEAQLVQIFIAYACSLPQTQAPEKTIIAARLKKWRELRQPQPAPELTALDVAAVARFWGMQGSAAQQQMDDALWHQFASLLPSLDLTTRASAWALLWGEQQELTRHWLTLARVLHQTGNASELAAPLSLLINNFGLPVKSFLAGPDLQNMEPRGDAAVPCRQASCGQQTFTIPPDALALLTREIVLGVEQSALDEVDIIDIPASHEQENPSLWQSKRGWLLEHYRQTLQPDVLVICNATTRLAQTTIAARTLYHWVKETQPENTATPGLVWAITPQDARFSSGQNLDEAVQILLGKPGIHWGTLLAMDNTSLRRLVAWLRQATTSALHQARLRALDKRHRQQLETLLQGWLTPSAASTHNAEALIRALQGQLAHHAELLENLLPPRRQFETLREAPPPREEHLSGLFSQAIDLFDDTRGQVDHASAPQIKSMGHKAHALWISHMRQWCRNEDNAARLGLEPAILRQTIDIIITTSYRLNLPYHLDPLTPQDGAGAAQLHAAIGNFIAWLGYGDLAPEQRPASRIQKGATIFSTPSPCSQTRLKRLEEQPVHAATRYIYDWLVALYTRANENVGYRNPLDISPSAREQLRLILARLKNATS